MNRLQPTLTAAVGPRVRKSPFFDCTVRAGLAAVSTYNHMWLPMGYGDPEGEYQRLTTAVSMWDVAAQRHIEVAGADADALVQYATVVDTATIERGTARYAPMVDHDGRLVNDPILIHLDDGSWRFSIADSDIRLWLDANRRARRLDCEIRELPTATLAVQGPNALATMRAAGVSFVDDLDDLAHRRAAIDGIDVIVSRSGWSMQGGVELFLDDVMHAPRLWDSIGAAGREFGIGPGAPNAPERIENALLSYGTDTGYDADPFELGLDDSIDDSVEEFIGKEALARLRSAKPERRLRGTVIGGDRMDVLPHPRPVRIGERRIGELRAAAWSPKFERNLGLVLVGAEVEPGAVIEIDLSMDRPDEVRSGRVVDLPFESSTIDD